jgi:hypothetical protein
MEDIVDTDVRLEIMKNMEAEEYEKIFSYWSNGSYIKGKDFLFIYQY